MVAHLVGQLAAGVFQTRRQLGDRVGVLVVDVLRLGRIGLPRRAERSTDPQCLEQLQRARADGKQAVGAGELAVGLRDQAASLE